jgi:hypothetical protein
MTGSVDNPTGTDAQYIYRPVGPTGLWITVRNHNSLVMQGNSDWEFSGPSLRTPMHLMHDLLPNLINN